MSHALLFHGFEGVGKEAHAIELCALLNCRNLINNSSCGNCTSCKKIKTFQHENIKLIVPLPRGKITSPADSTIKAFKNEKMLTDYQAMTKNKGTDPYYKIKIKGANTILINSVREIKQDISLSISQNEWKFILIFEAEKLCFPNSTAGHALLKLLEEPPERTIIILVTSNSEMLLDTIKSRCQRLYFSPISNTIIENQLIENGYDPIQSAIIARLSSGNIVLSKLLLENFTDLMDKLNIFVEACFNENSNTWEKFINIAARLKNNNYTHLEQVFRCGKLFFRDLYYYSTTALDDQIIYKKQINRIKKLCISFPKSDWQSCIQIIENSQHFIIRNGFMPLIITTLFLEINKTIHGEKYQAFELSDWIEL